MALSPGAGVAAAAKKKAKCKPGTVPMLKQRGRTTRVVKSRSGKARCRKPAKLRAKGVRRPSTRAQAQLASIADQFEQSLAVKSGAFSKIQRKIGARRTKKLTQLALKAWRKQAGAAAADDGGLHLDTSFGSGTGTSATVKLDAVPVSADGKLGMQATANVVIDVTAEGLKDMARDALGDAKSARATLDVSFSDVPIACPTAEGKVDGQLAGKVKVTLTTKGRSGAVTQSASASMDVKYALTVGENARWETIDQLEARSEFSYGGTGKGTETWRGRRFGGGFGQKGIFGEGSSSVDAGIADGYKHFDQTRGGVFGPHTSIRYDNGPTAWDIQSISNLKGMLVTQVATDYLTLAALEYIRAVVAPRLQKHWYDEEACLRISGKPGAAKLRSGQQTSVTASNAKAANGTPVKTGLTASGVASLLPGAATMGPGASYEFKLTAPNATPTRSSWKIVALSRAGKKTVDGTLGDDPAFEVRLDLHATSDYATHAGTGRIVAALRLEPAAFSQPARWTAGSALSWTELTVDSKLAGCTYSDPITGGAWSVTATQTSDDAVTIELDFSADTRALWTLNCPDSPPIPGQPTVMAVGITTLKFTLPITGGAQQLSGDISDGGSYIRNSGTLTLVPVG